jgi:cytochrome oxidase Cu insertion factor (SCO1/SenC/PrrC family)
LLALAPTPESSPEWLLVTREVCFGSLPERLPSAQGWISLAAPIPMLVALLAICGGELRQQMSRLRHSFRVILVMLPLFTLGYTALRVAQEWPTAMPDPAALPMSPDHPVLDLELPEFQLTDQDGQVFEGENLQGRVTVLTFAYAHCATVCPLLLQTMRELESPYKVVVTLDPWRDTCGNLASIAATWNLGSTRVLSGDPAQVALLTAALNVPVTRDEKTGEIFHPSLVFVLDKRGRVAYGFTDPNQAWLEEAVSRAERL